MSALDCSPQLLAISSIDLSYLPYHLAVSVIKKVRFTALVRLYRANSTMRGYIDICKAIPVENLEFYQDFIQFLVGFHRLLDEAGERLLKGDDLSQEAHEIIDQMGQEIAELGIQLHRRLPYDLQRRLRILLTLRDFCDKNSVAYKKMWVFIQSVEKKEDADCPY